MSERLGWRQTRAPFGFGTLGFVVDPLSAMAVEDLGPTASLYPQGEWYGVSDEAAVIRLVDERLVAGRAVPELRIDQPDGGAPTH